VTAAAEWPCPRCGTSYAGSFCPACGLPRAFVFPLPPPPPSSGVRSLLTILWTIAIAGFLVVVALDFAGLVLAPGVVVPNAQGISRGASANPSLDLGDAPWTFLGTGTPAPTGTWVGSGGNPDGHLETTLPNGTNVVGYWSQSLEVSGSTPFTGEADLDVDVTNGSSTTLVRVLVYLSPAPGVPSASTLIGFANYTGRTAWEPTTFEGDPALAGPGTYRLTVAVTAVTTGPGTPTVVRIDNVRFRWTTDAAVVLYLFLPAPIILFVSQDVSLFTAYFALLVVVVAGSAVFHAVRDRKEIAAALLAPLEAIGPRLRTKSAWLTIAQVWLAFTAFQVAVIFLMYLSNIEPTSPIDITPENAWVFFFDLLNASVYEELAFRVLLMGVPMAVGSLIVRVMEVNRAGGTGRGTTTPGRHILGSLRYLVGGRVSRGATRETLLASWAVLLASAVVFGAAHMPGWGWWKVVPSFIAGLAFGYLFLRHGVTAAILAHFVNDYLSSLTWIGVGGDALAIFIGLLFLAVAIAGLGFFAWYLIVAWRHLKDLAARFLGRPHLVRPAAAPAVPPAAYPLPPPIPDARPPYPPAPPASAASPRDPMVVPPGYAPTYVPPPYGYPPVRFQCPSCGWVEARFEGGRFTCLRCGRVA